MKRIIDFLVIIPLGIMMSGPFAVGGTIAGFILGLLVGKFVL